MLKTNPPRRSRNNALADQAQTDFEDVKKLLDGGKVSHLDALRLNNDYRRIGAERTRIVRREARHRRGSARHGRELPERGQLGWSTTPATTASKPTACSKSSRGSEQVEKRARAVFDELERKHMLLLTRRRDASSRSSPTASRRPTNRSSGGCRVLDEHFGFIRTNIFWVRDEEPVGPESLMLAQREAVQLARGGVRMAEELMDRSARGYFSVEFGVALLGLVVLPWPFLRLHARLKKLAPAAPAGSASAPASSG
ncbi:MAG: hypothetical protein U0835_09025 [Isosphaeraceae bacterium]